MLRRRDTWTFFPQPCTTTCSCVIARFCAHSSSCGQTWWCALCSDLESDSPMVQGSPLVLAHVEFLPARRRFRRSPV